MPRTKPKPDPFRMPPIELTLELAARFRALDTPTDTDMTCDLCEHGVGIAKRRSPAGRLERLSHSPTEVAGDEADGLKFTALQG